MIFTAWQKMNTTARHIGLASAFGIAILTGYYLMTSRPDIDLAAVNAITIIVAGVGAIASRFIAVYFGTTWSRVLPFQPHQLESDFRLLFTNNNISFTSNRDKRTYSYDFQTEGVKMTIESYKVPPTTAFSKPDKTPATKITLNGITQSNRSFTNDLTKLIDKMAKAKDKEKE